MSENYVKMEIDQCKGCRLCMNVCPKGCFVIGSAINKIGYQNAQFKQNGCTACGLCFYVCPEPGTITVFKGEKS